MVLAETPLGHQPPPAPGFLRLLGLRASAQSLRPRPLSSSSPRNPSSQESQPFTDKPFFLKNDSFKVLSPAQGQSQLFRKGKREPIRSHLSASPSLLCLN